MLSFPLAAQDQPAAAPPAVPPVDVEPVEKSQVSQTQMQPLFGAQLPKSAHWKPLTEGERWRIFYKQVFGSPVTVVRPMIPTMLTQASRNPEQWPRTWNGLGRRFAANWVGTVVGDFTETAGAAIFRHDTRYIACQCTNVKGRMWNAVRQVGQTYNDRGQWVIAGPRIFSNYASSAVTVFALYPREPHLVNEFVSFGTSQFYFSAFGNLSREFLPDLLRMVHKKKNRASLTPAPPPPATK